jgi:hypothetical protein
MGQSKPKRGVRVVRPRQFGNPNAHVLMVHAQQRNLPMLDEYGSSLAENPRGYCPNHATGVKLPDDFVVTPLQLID